MTSEGGRGAVEAVWRIESARIVGTLARYTGDFALAEDLAQEAFAEALVSWPRDGVPRQPAGWLLTTARRRAIDGFRRRTARDDRYAELARNTADDADRNDDLLWDPDRLDDDLLALVFTACHPVLSREAAVALTLRVVGGLTSDEIARCFLIPTATVQARITRAKKTIAAAAVPFAVPDAADRRERLGPVLSVVYLIFTEGSVATSGPTWIRTDLASEALREARILSRLLPEENEVHGLLALLELTASRFPARVAADGSPILLADQNRSRWDASAIRRGRAALRRAGAAGKGLGPYGLQAAIAECHAVARTVADTDWDRIVALYDGLRSIAPSPVVELNRAVAVSMAHGPGPALEAVDEIVDAGSLAGNHLLPSVRAELLVRLGQVEKARSEFRVAIDLCGNDAERALLQDKLDALG